MLEHARKRMHGCSDELNMWSKKSWSASFMPATSTKELQFDLAAAYVIHYSCPKQE
jgi:hypothetical protein